MTFESLGVSAQLVKELNKLNYAHPYPIQQYVIPAVLNKKDVLGIAPTGSGKTASYVLPILMNLQRKALSKNRHVDVLILVPTRELAVQVREVFYSFSLTLPEKIKSMAVYGGVSINPQMMALQGVNILVATPGRLLELTECNAVKLSEIDTLILDEADKMLDLGFQEEVNRILKLLPRKRQNLLFSATLSDNVNEINQFILHDPIVVKIEEEKTNIDLITQTAYLVNDDKKGPLLRQLIKNKQMKQVLVFTSSTYKADNVANKLRKNGINAQAIHSGKSQGARTETLKQFKAGAITALIATDLISRGIDIKFLPYVINYELPRSPKDYIHRIGRTGRAESPGEAISLIAPGEEHHFKVIQKKMGKQVTLLKEEDLNAKG